MWRVFGKCVEITPHICQTRNFGSMITAAQCRSARTLLSWSLNKLASAASVPTNVIDSFEMERLRPDAATLGALQRAFEDVGLVFLPDDDVRVRAATSPDKLLWPGSAATAHGPVILDRQANELARPMAKPTGHSVVLNHYHNHNTIHVNDGAG